MLEEILHNSFVPLIILLVVFGILFINRRRPTHTVVSLLYFTSISLTGVFVWFLIYTNLIFTSTIWIAPLILFVLLFVTTLIYWDFSKKTDLERQQSITMVSHNFLTPLTRIKYAIGTLLKETASIPEAQQQKINDLAHHVMNDANRLIHGTTVLLEFSDLAEHKDVAHFGQTDVSQVLDELQENFREVMLAKNLTYKIEIPEGVLPKVIISKFYLKTVLEVFLDNAQNYTPIGGTVLLKITRDKKYLNFSVIDLGIGLTKDNQKHVFERFYMPTSATAIKDSGMGLGLSVSKDIIKRNSGKIWVSSEGPGKGSSFSFSLPYVK